MSRSSLAAALAAAAALVPLGCRPEKPTLAPSPGPLVGGVFRCITERRRLWWASPR